MLCQVVQDGGIIWFVSDMTHYNTKPGSGEGEKCSLSLNGRPKDKKNHLHIYLV